MIVAEYFFRNTGIDLSQRFVAFFQPARRKTTDIFFFAIPGNGLAAWRTGIDGWATGRNLSRVGIILIQTH
jgi:hypothetical protein